MPNQTYSWANAKQASPFQSDGSYAAGNSRGTGGGRPQMPTRMNGPAPQATPMSGVFAQNPGAAQGLAQVGPRMMTGQMPSGPAPTRAEPAQVRGNMPLNATKAPMDPAQVRGSMDAAGANAMAARQQMAQKYAQARAGAAGAPQVAASPLQGMKVPVAG